MFPHFITESEEDGKYLGNVTVSILLEVVVKQLGLVDDVARLPYQDLDPVQDLLLLRKKVPILSRYRRQILCQILHLEF